MWGSPKNLFGHACFQYKGCQPEGVRLLFIITVMQVSVAQLDPRPTGDQEVAGSTPAGSWRLIMKYFLQKILSFPLIQSENFHFLVVKFSVYLNRRVFVMRSGLHYSVDFQKPAFKNVYYFLQLLFWLHKPVLMCLTTPYSSKIDIFIQERFNKF